MARKWLNLFTGAALSFAVAGNALADEGKITVFAAASLTNACLLYTSDAADEL